LISEATRAKQATLALPPTVKNGISIILSFVYFLDKKFKRDIVGANYE
jgi:hypothetical protein